MGIIDDRRELSGTYTSVIDDLNDDGEFLGVRAGPEENDTADFDVLPR